MALKFAKHYKLNFIPIKFELFNDKDNNGFYKKKQIPNKQITGWKNWKFEKCLKFYNEYPSDYILIDLSNSKFMVIDCDSQESYNEIYDIIKCNYFDNDDELMDEYKQNYITKSVSKYLETRDKKIIDSDKKHHFYLLKNNDYDIKTKINKDRKIDLIYDTHIFERVDNNLNYKSNKLMYDEEMHNYLFPKIVKNDITHDVITDVKVDDNKNIREFSDVNQTYMMYYELFQLINIKKIEDYDCWIIIGFSILSLKLKENEKLRLFIDVSKMSKKYENEDDDIYITKFVELENNESDKKVSIATIKYWAKMNNFEKYNLWTKKWLKNRSLHNNFDNNLFKIDPSDNWSYIEINERYLPYHIICDGFTLINSHLGTGKTTFITNLIKNDIEAKFLIITPREIYSQNICSELNKNKLGFESYQNYKNKKFDRYICQIESLHKINCEYDYIIMDECESILKQLTSFETHSNNFMKNVNSFYKLITNTKKVILADAFCTNRSRDFINNFNKRCEFINNTFNPYDRKAIEYDDYNSFCNKIIESIQNDKKIVIVWSSKNRGQKFCDSDKFKEVIKSKKYLFYHGDRDKNYNNSIKDVNNNWMVDVLMYTSKITVGVNFDIKHYDQIFIYGTADSCCVRDIFQSSLRVRNLNYNLLHYYIENEYVYAKNLCLNTDYDMIFKEISENKILINNFIEKKQIDYIEFENLPNFLRDIYVYNIFEENNNKIYYNEIFNYYLRICGYTKQINEYFKNDKFNEGQILKNKYDEIKDISQDQYQKLKTKLENYYDLNSENLESMSKFVFKNYFIENTDDLLLKIIYDSYFITGKKNLFYNIMKKINEINGEDKLYNDYSKNKYAELISQDYQKLEYIQNILKISGLECINDNTIISYDRLKNVYDYLETNYHIIHKTYKLQDKSKTDEITSRKLYELFNKIIFNYYGYELVKYDEKNIRLKNGKREKQCSYKLMNKICNLDFKNYLKCNKIDDDKLNENPLDYFPSQN